ncbi:MAG TPA: DUF1963 domain-containing protein [Candidatus Elarobacter sp.]|nr:DUF1963 domain-containing protein [Candidatus Elarobacter sp.]
MSRGSRKLEELKARLTRPASLIELADRRTASSDPLASWFGRISVALPGEEWPESGGELMVPVAQLNLSEAPYVPPALGDVALVSVYFGRDELSGSTQNGDGWLVRAYSSLEGLRAIEVPPEAAGGVCWLSGADGPIKPSPLRYRLLQNDYPDYEDLPPDVDEDLAERFTEDLSASPGSKLGGWPSLIQGEVSWAPWREHPANPEYAFQLGAMAKTNFWLADDGMCYFGRGTGAARDVWTFEWQIA